jgi:hypothetical protein
MFLRSAVTSHNSLSGLQGGILAEYFHLSAAELAIVQATSELILGIMQTRFILGLLLVNKTPWFRLQILKPLTLYLF